MTLRASSNIFLNRDTDQLSFYLAQVVCGLNQLFEKRERWKPIIEYNVDVQRRQGSNGNPIFVNVYIRPADWPKHSFVLIGFLVNLGYGSWVIEDIRLLASHLDFPDPVTLVAHDRTGYTVLTLDSANSLPDHTDSSDSDPTQVM